MSACCLSGKVHSGKPSGREDTIGGVHTYIAEPEGGSRAKSIVFITDSRSYQPSSPDQSSLSPFPVQYQSPLVDHPSSPTI